LCEALDDAAQEEHVIDEVLIDEHLVRAASEDDHPCRIPTAAAVGVDRFEKLCCLALGALENGRYHHVCCLSRRRR
jgi:hypothetical protein